MYPTFGIADGSYLFGVPYGEEVERRSSIPSTNLTMANADADRLSLDPKSNFAAITAAGPIPHVELLSRFLMAASRTTRGHDPVLIAKRRPSRPLCAISGRSRGGWQRLDSTLCCPLVYLGDAELGLGHFDAAIDAYHRGRP